MRDANASRESAAGAVPDAVHEAVPEAVPDAAPGPGTVPAGEGLRGGFVGVTLATLAGNALSYLLLLAAARVLVKADYGELVTLLNLLLIAYVPTLALQAVTARRVATGHGGGLFRATVIIAVTAAAVVLVATPAIVAFLHLPNALGPVLVAAALPGTAVQGWCQGVWQGRSRFNALALTTIAGLVGRSGVGLLGLLAGRSALSTLVSIAIGGTIAAIGSTIALGSAARVRDSSDPVRAVLVECGHASHAYGVFLLLSATDLLLARHSLSTDLAATYAAGSVLTRIALWLPQSVANVLFASLTDDDRHNGLFLRAVLALCGLGMLEVGGTLVLSEFVTRIVGGGKYPSLSHDIWIFAVIGACLAMLQFSLVAGLARRSTAITLLLWLTIAADSVAVLSLGSRADVRSIATVVSVISLCSAVIAVGLRVRPGARRPVRPGASRAVRPTPSRRD